LTFGKNKTPEWFFRLAIGEQDQSPLNVNSVACFFDPEKIQVLFGIYLRWMSVFQVHFNNFYGIFVWLLSSGTKPDKAIP